MPDSHARARVDIRWRRLDQPARESASLARTAEGWELAGRVEGSDERGRHYSLHYRVRVDDTWCTRSALVEGTHGGAAVRVRLSRHAETGVWTRDDVEVPAVAGCIDVDLGFTPATNTLPIRRLALVVGDSAAMRAAWLRFPSFELEALDQLYTREASDRYRYESGGGRFRAELEVDAAGLVTRYGDYWIAEPAPAR